MADNGQNDASVLFGENKSTPAQTTGVSFSPEADADILFGGSKPQQESASVPVSPSPESELAPPMPKQHSEDSNLLFGSAVTTPDQPQQINVQDRPTPASDAPWYEKLWDFANAPLVDNSTLKNWFGADVEHWNGWGRGLMDLAEGLTSPLQLALMIGTFGGSALEGIGLKTAGKVALEGIMSADEIGQVTKGSEFLAKAIKSGYKAETAFDVMAEKGINPEVVKSGLEELDKAGIKASSLYSNGIIRKTGSSMLRAAGMELATADKVANFAQFAVDAGFTLQNGYAAAIASPRVLDAIKEGDYETAKRLAVDALGSGIFAVLGGAAAHEHAGDLMSDAEAKLGLRVKPSEENTKLVKLMEPLERDRVIAGEREKQWTDETRDKFPEFKPDKKWIAGGNSESDLRARFYRESEGREDIQNMAAWHDAIAEAAGRSDERIVGSETSFPPNIQDVIDSGKLKQKPKGYVDQLLRASDPRLLTEKEIEYAKHTGDHFDETGTRAVGNESLPALWDNYVTRIWKDPENDTIRKFRTTARTSDFSVNTAMARKRVFETTLEGILKGYELENHDMVSLAAHNGNEFARIAAARGFLQRLRGAGAKASDGRPMAALSGAGHVVESVDEEGNTVNPATFIKPSGMQGIRMANKVVEGLKEQIVKPGIEAGPDVSETTSNVHPERFLDRVGDAKGTSDRHNADLENLFRTSGGQWPKGVPPVEIQLDEGGNVIGADGRYRASLANQNNIESVPIKVTRKLTPTKGRPAVTQLDQLVKEGRVVKLGVDKHGNDMYAWTTHDYMTVDNPAFHGWKMPTSDSEGNPIFVQGEMRVHPEAHEYLSRRFDVDKGLTSKIPGMKGALSAAREAKGLLLFISPFHFIQEGLRAIMTGISPIGMERFNPNNPIHVLAAEKGVWEFKDYKGIRAFEDGLVGHSKLLAKVPGLREIQSWVQTQLFERYIPGLKLRGFESLYNRYKEAFPDWTKEKVAEKAADDTNNRFGGISYKRMGRSAATMDVARLVALAPDWLESEVRFMKSLFGDEGKITRRDTAKMALLMWGASRVLNYLVSGKPHNEAPFGVAWKDDEGREKVYSLRTLPTDALHAASDPIGFLNGRFSPLVRVGAETYMGRDEYGRKLTTNGIFVNLLRNVSPIPVQGLAKAATGESPEISKTDFAVKAAGGTVFPYRTEGQKLAAKLASDRSEQGMVDKDKLRRHQAVIQLETALRNGKTSVQDIYQAVEGGQLHPTEAKEIIKNVQQTQGLDPDMARLYSHAARLPLKDFLSVWDASTNEERMLLSKLLIKKQQNYFKRVAKEMSPAERASDPVYQRLRRMFPDQQPF